MNRCLQSADALEALFGAFTISWSGYAVVILIAMLAAKGTSVLRNVNVINRGYEQLTDRLNLLGAHIETFHDLPATGPDAAG